MCRVTFFEQNKFYDISPITLYTCIKSIVFHFCCSDYDLERKLFCKA